MNYLIIKTYLDYWDEVLDLDYWDELLDLDYWDELLIEMKYLI